MMNVVSTGRHHNSSGCSTPCCSSPEGSCLYFSTDPYFTEGSYLYFSTPTTEECSKETNN
jgi:hypothetical protein